MVDVRGSTFSFSFEDRRGCLEAGVGSSSIEVEGEAVLIVYVPEATGVIEVAATAGEPLLMMCTIFFPILDNGSSFFVLILAYMSLSNLVVISARGTRVKKIYIYVRRVLKRLRLTLFSFNTKSPQDEGRGLRTKAVKGKSPWIHKVVPILNRARVLNCFPHPFSVPVLQLRPCLNCSRRKT